MSTDCLRTCAAVAGRCMSPAACGAFSFFKHGVVDLQQDAADVAAGASAALNPKP